MPPEEPAIPRCNYSINGLLLAWGLSSSLLAWLADCSTVWLFASLADDGQLPGRLVYILPANFFFLPLCLPTICHPRCFLLKEIEEIAPVNVPFSTNSVVQPSSAPIREKCLDSPVADHPPTFLKQYHYWCSTCEANIFFFKKCINTGCFFFSLENLEQGTRRSTLQKTEKSFFCPMSSGKQPW